MRVLRAIAGLAAIAAVAYALNLFVLYESMFNEQVLVPLAIGAGLAVVWGLLKLAMLSEAGRGATLNGVNGIVGSVAFLGICIVLFGFAKRYDHEWDLTQEGRRDLAPQTVQVLESLTREVRAYGFFVQSGDPLIDVAQEKTRRFLERCREITPLLKVEFVDPQRNPEALEVMNVLRVSEVGTIVLQSGTRQREIPLSDVTNRVDERQFTNALVNVARDSVPKVYFLTGHGERDLDSEDAKIGGHKFRLWLESEGYEVVPFVIPTDRPAIPRDCSVLVINGYESDISGYEVEALDEFVSNGGRLFVLVDPQIILTPAGMGVEHMRPWLRNRFGVSVNADIVVSHATEGYRALFIPDFKLLGEIADTVEPNPEFRGSYNKTHPVTRILDKQMVMSLARSVSLSEEDKPKEAAAAVLLRTTPDTWAEEDLAAVVQRRPIGPTEGEAKGPLPAAVAVSVPSDVRVGEGERRRDARVVVVGDSSIAANEGINFAGNQDFLLNTIAWLAEKEELIAIRPEGPAQAPILLTNREQRLIAWIAVLGIVQAVGLAGFASWLWRRRFQ